MAVYNYQYVSVEKEKELSDVLYRKTKCNSNPKRQPTATITTADIPNFNIGTLSQDEPSAKQCKVQPMIQTPQVDIRNPIVNIPEKPIVVQPVVNLNAKDLKWNELGELVLPEIKVEVIININWHLDFMNCVLHELGN